MDRNLNLVDLKNLNKRNRRTSSSSVSVTSTTIATTNNFARKVAGALLSFLIVAAMTTRHSSHALSSNIDTNAKPAVAVIGATGRLGRLAVQELVDQGVPCRLLVRKMPSSTSTAPSSISSLDECDTSEDVLAYFQSLPDVTLIKGDVNDLEALKTLVMAPSDGDGDDSSSTGSCGACLALHGATRRSKLSDLWNHKSVEDNDLTHAKQVNYQGVLNLIQACQASPNCKRIVRITGKGEDPTGFFSVLINLLGSMAKAWNYQGEQALRAAAGASASASASTSTASSPGASNSSKKIDYTIIRPGVMSDDAPAPGGTEGVKLLLADNGGDLPVARIRYQDIAKLCVECLDYPNAADCTLTAMTTTKTEENDSSSSSSSTTWGPLLAKVRPDRRTFPSDMLEQHYAAVRNVLFKGFGGVAAVLLAILVKVFLV